MQNRTALHMSSHLGLGVHGSLAGNSLNRTGMRIAGFPPFPISCQLFRSQGRLGLAPALSHHRAVRRGSPSCHSCYRSVFRPVGYGGERPRCPSVRAVKRCGGAAPQSLIESSAVSPFAKLANLWFATFSFRFAICIYAAEAPPLCHLGVVLRRFLHHPLVKQERIELPSHPPHMRNTAPPPLGCSMSPVCSGLSSHTAPVSFRRNRVSMSESVKYRRFFIYPDALPGSAPRQ